MAKSPPHRFGQIIGNLLEEIMEPILRKYCNDRRLYLDVEGRRPGVRPGMKVTWYDKYGNAHNLDFVIEKGGTENKRGRPVAFIEAAWRRYTKHSRNKAQEIQSAVSPIADKHQWDRPFLGVVLAGEFTQGSLDQLHSAGFKVLYFPYDSVVSAFRSVEIDVRFDEDTLDEAFKVCVNQIEGLSVEDRDQVKRSLIEENRGLFDSFLVELSSALNRVIERLIIIPFFGKKHEFGSIEEAAHYINKFVENEVSGEFQRYEIIVKYSNGDHHEASLQDKVEAEKFLQFLSRRYL